VEEQINTYSYIKKKEVGLAFANVNGRGWIMRTGGHTVKVLLAESDKQAGKQLELALKMCGCRVMHAVSADKCLALAKQNDVELLLIDLALPARSKMNCEEVIRQIKDMNREAKIVTMAGENTRELELRIRRHSILCYLTKPVLPSLIQELVLHLRKRKRAADADIAHQPRL
jgi:DNA-binding response OmpR family regulator